MDYNTDLREKRREAIIQAAMNVFYKNGYERAKMESIAAEAGIGKATIYEYFSSKKQLFEEMIDFNLDKYKEDFRRIIKGKGTFCEKFHDLCLYHADFLSQHLDILQFSIQQKTVLSNSMKNRLLDGQREVFGMLREMLEEAVSNGEIRKDIDREAACMCIMGVIAQLVGKRIFVDKVDIRDIDLIPLLDILMHGLAEKSVGNAV